MRQHKPPKASSRLQPSPKPVKKAKGPVKGDKLSSTLWLKRQHNDPYVAEARRQGYRSRAAFKLQEMDDRFRLLRPGMVIVDLGAAPGGWTQIAVERVGAKSLIVAVDRLPIEAIAGAQVLMMDFMEPDAPDQIIAVLNGKKADLVLSDMAPSFTGHAATDHLRSMGLVEAAYDFACQILAPHGSFLAKVVQGGSEKDLLAALKRDFAKVRHVKPQASRAESAELYVLATEFRGTQQKS